jgi:hypothetical protein
VVLKEKADMVLKDPRVAAALKERADMALKDPRVAAALKERADMALKDPRVAAALKERAEIFRSRQVKRRWCRRTVRVVLEMNMMIVTKVKCAALMIAAITTAFPETHVLPMLPSCLL